MPGSNITEPRPRRSKYLATEHAGFVVLEKGAGFYLQAKVIQHPVKPLYMRAHYDNPMDKGKPFINDMEFPPKAGKFMFSSPDVVWGVRNYQDYTIRVSIYENRTSSTPVDTLVQPVRSYVDTTTGEVRIFKGMQPR